jgi:hypothetical protein
MDGPHEQSAAAAGSRLQLLNVALWWNAERLLSGRRVAIADIAELPLLSKRSNSAKSDVFPKRDL